jgi:hypothetical protein
MLKLVQKCVVKLCSIKLKLFFTYKTNQIHFNYSLSDDFIKNFDCVKDCNRIFGNKLHLILMLTTYTVKH